MVLKTPIYRYNVEDCEIWYKSTVGFTIKTDIVALVQKHTYVDHYLSCSIGHPPHSSASPVELRLQVGPRALSEKKNLGNRG